MVKNKKIALSANTAWFLEHFESGLVSRLRDEGHEVHLIAPDAENPVEIDRKGMNPLRDSRTIWQYYRTLRRLKPDVLLNFTIKPVLYGSIVARMLGIPIVNTITGMGTAYIDGGVKKWIVDQLYTLALNTDAKIMTLNTEDAKYFNQRGWHTTIVPGAGVNLEHFAYVPPIENEKMTFLFIGRLLKDKGVYELVEAARKLNAGARVQLLGSLDTGNRSSVTQEELDGWVSEGVVEYLGTTNDVRHCIQAADCIVLPSYCEGLPTVLLEASAIGRPIIATDVPGCKDVVEDGTNGYLAPKGSAVALHDAMTRMMEVGHDARAVIGRAGREKAEEEFDEKIVITAYLDTINQILQKSL